MEKIIELFRKKLIVILWVIFYTICCSGVYNYNKMLLLLHSCWLSVEQGTIYAFVAPMIAIIIVSIALGTLIMLCKIPLPKY